MDVRKKSGQRFCSAICQAEWQKTRTGELNPNYSKESIICDYCGKEFLISKYRVNLTTHHFCDKKCRQKWYSTIWSQSETWKEESRKRAAKLLSNNPITLTIPQLQLNTILQELEVKYKNEEVFGHYSLDNYLYEENLMIEVMGDYWHCNRLIYDTIR